MTSFDAFLGLEGLTTLERMNRERRWVGWKIDWRGNAPTKVPVNPLTGQLAKSNDPTTWASRGDAEAAVARYALAGIGFMLGNGWAGIDIDGDAAWKTTSPKDDDERHARRKVVYEREYGGRTVGEWLAEIGSYAEFSPNDGLKVIVYGIPENGQDSHKNGAGLEFYKGTRFFTVTGEKLLDHASNLDAFRALAACRPSRRSSSSPSSAAPAGSSTRYGSRALEAEIAVLLRTPEGNRNNALNTAAFKLGQLVAGEELDEGEALHALERAALGTGLGADEIRRTLERALSDGKAEPRRAPERPTPPPRSPEEKPPERNEQEIVWGEPVSFPADNIEAASSFPSHVLPKVALDVVKAISRFVQVDESLVAQDVLGIASFPIARKIVVAEGAWIEEANLWTIGAADSGERKSATLRLVVRPVREVERERRLAERELMASEEANIELLQHQYEAAVKKAAREENDVERIAAETQVRELAQQLADSKDGRTRRTRLIVDDVTPEFFGKELAENNPLLFANAEGGLLDNFINRYQNIPNLDLLNQSFTGDDCSPGRSTRNADPVERPLACFALSPQPVVVSGLTTNPILVARGTLSRFLYWFVPPMAGSREVGTQELDRAALDAWGNRMRELLSLTDPGEEPYCVRMSAEAVEVMLGYRQHIENTLLATDGAGMRAWLNRARGHAQRLALVLHVIEHGLDAVTCEIEAKSASAAVALMNAYEEHAGIAFDLMDESPLLKRSRTMLGWLRSRNAEGETLTVREAHRSHQRWGSVRECREVLAELHGRGWIWMESKDASTFVVHPDLCKSDDSDDRRRRM